MKVEEEQIRDVVIKRRLRGVTPDEWKAFITHIPGDALQETQFKIALMFTGQLDESEAHFPQTIVYSPKTTKLDFVSNWTMRFWEPDFAFMFAEKQSDSHLSRPTQPFPVDIPTNRLLSSI